MRRLRTLKSYRICRRMCAEASLVLLLLAFSLVHAGASNPQLFGTTGLDQSFCKDKTFRQTVVYVDANSVKQGITAWAADLENKLRATLTPGERVSLIELLPTDGTSTELWSACWPDYTAAQRNILAKKTYFFSSNPLNDLAKQQGFFFNGFGAAITQIFIAQAKNKMGDQPQLKGAPKEEIVEALASDGARFSQSNQTIRVIVYTNAAQNSTLGSVYDHTTPSPSDYGKMLGTFFRHSIFYFFGVQSTLPDDPTYLADAHSFWNGALSSMDSTVAGFGSDLSVANDVPTVDHRFHITLKRNNLDLSGLLYVMTDADGNLIDSWMGVSRLGFVSLTGTFTCSANLCSLNATTNQGLVTTSNTETLTLKGNLTKNLNGSIGVQGSVTFPVVASAVH